jgi:hypothetical protein
MGYPCVRLAGRFLASYDDKLGGLVVKLPRECVLELIADGSGEPFAPTGKVFREWVAIPTADCVLWQRLLAEAGRLRSQSPFRVTIGLTAAHAGAIVSVLVN